MAFTFLAAEGYEVGKSLLEQDQIETVRRYFNDAAAGGKQIVLPSDIVVAPEAAADATPTVVPAVRYRLTRSDLTSAPTRPGVRRGDRHAKTVFWNGPMGVAEWESRRRHQSGGAGGHRDGRTVGDRRR